VSELGGVPLLLAEHLSLIEGVTSFASWHGVSIVFVLMGHHDKPDGGRTLTGNHGAPGEEDFVEAEGALTVLLDNSVLVLDEVVVPHLDSMGVVHSLVADSLYFEASTFDLVDVPVEGAGGIRSGEDVLAHEDAPE